MSSHCKQTSKIVLLLAIRAILTGVHIAEYLESSLLRSCGFRHGFFTRRGGVSDTAFASLNFAISAGDSPENVAQNLGLAAKVLGVDPSHICYLNQIHGIVVREIGVHDDAQALRFVEGDIVVSVDPLTAAAVRVADCAPVLIGDCKTGHVAAVHSGWRGTVANAVQTAVRALEMRGSQSKNLVAAVGPHIQACCFEVGLDVAEQIEGASPVLGLRKPGKPGKALVDLRTMIHAQLELSGISKDRIDHIYGCSMCDSDRFFSYRRDGARSGRHLCAIVPLTT